MVENPIQRSHAEEVAGVYVGIVAATSGHSLTVVEAALAMALTLIGERRGLTGPALVDWIETIATASSIAAHRNVENPELRPTDIIAREALN